MAKGETYEEFTQKFKPKKTTDDCYTPPGVYNAVLEWVRANIPASAGREVIRPFYPGGDYQSEDYEGKVVVDNPPFSLMTPIVRWYTERGIPFFLFAPSLTLFCVAVDKCEEITYVMTAARVVYENGAAVNTSFVTNMIPEYMIMTAPELKQRVEEASDEERARRTATLPRYSYPAHVLRSGDAAVLSRAALKIPRGHARRIGALDSQRPLKKALYGGGFLLSEAMAKESERVRLESERVRLETERARATVWELSPREWEIVKNLG